MTDVGFVIAGFTGILGSLAIYGATLALRLRRSRRDEAALRGETPAPDGRAAPRGE